MPQCYLKMQCRYLILQRRASEKDEEKAKDAERMKSLTKQELLEGQVEAILEAKAK